MIEDTKIILITERFEKEDRHGYGTGEYEVLVSHGIGNNTLKNHVLPNDPPEFFDAKRDQQTGELYIPIENKDGD